MKKMNNFSCSAIAFAILLFAQTLHAQDSAKAAPKRPNINTNVKLTSNQDINNFVTQSFGIYGNMEDLSQKIQAIQNQIIGGAATGGLSQSLADLNDAMNGFRNIRSNGPALVTSVTTIIANVKDYHISIFEIPRTLLNLKEALKALKYSIENSIYLLSFSAELKSKITGTKIPVDSEQHELPADKTTVIAAGQTEKIINTIITVKGINFSKLQELEDIIRTCPFIKTTNKSLRAGIATLTITHTGSLSQLWKFSSDHCKEIANADLTTWDEANGRIDIAMK